MGKMRVFHYVSSALLVVLMSLQWKLANGQQISVVNGSYEGILIAIGNDLVPTKCNVYISDIKRMIDSASELLYSATNNRLSFSKVTILVPEGWSNCGADVTPNEMTFEDAHIRVHQSHPFFIDNPWTEQPRGCGKPGNFIYFSAPFINNTNNQLGSPGAVFVHEWAKFRWGVFEEYGHYGDPIYPSAFRENGTSWHPNYCTDGEVQGVYDSCAADTTEAQCKFTPNPDQGNLTSSLLAAPFVDSVVTFCDESNHIASAPTKHNLMCNKKSVWEVLLNHSDFKNMPGGNAVQNTTYTIRMMDKSAAQERLVFVIDVTEKMEVLKNTWGYVRDAVRQFIKIKASLGSQIGVVPFGKNISAPTELLTVNATNRVTLAEAIPDSANLIGTKDVGAGLAHAAMMLGKTGKIILITENMAKYEHSSDILIEKANGLAVQPILYPAHPDVTSDPYKMLAEISGFKPMVVNSVNISGSQSTANLFRLTQLIQESGSKKVFTVNAGLRSGSGNIALLVNNTADYEESFVIEILHDFIPNELVINATGPNGDAISILSRDDFIDTFKGTILQEGIYKINVQFFGVFAKLNSTTYASLVAQKRQKSQTFNVAVSASSPLDSMEFTQSTAPVIYAKLSDGYKQVINAEVRAMIRTSTTASAGINNITLTLHDNGFGGDVTANDGIYSSYLLGVTEVGRFSVSISANDNNGTAKIINSTSSRTAPVNSEALTSACCGSKLDLPAEILFSTGTFSTSSSPGINGKTTGTIPSNYPPSRVTDLQATRRRLEVTLSFTATGDDFDQGEASYILHFGNGKTKNLNESEPAGTPISIIETIECNTLYTFTVIAKDDENLTSQPSNEVKMYISCDIVDPSPKPLTKGAIAGIVIGCIFLIIILIMIIYLCLHRDNLGENRLWKVLTCRCFKKKKDSSRHLGRSRTTKSDVIRTNNPGPIREPQEVYGENNVDSGGPALGPIRNLEDMYGKPDLEAKWKARNKKMEDSDDDGGFDDHRNQQFNTQQQENMRMRDMGRDNYVSHPVNQVGIPPATRQHYNYGYSDTESSTAGNGEYAPSQQYGTGNKKPMVPPRKPVTQV